MNFYVKIHKDYLNNSKYKYWRRHLTEVCKFPKTGSEGVNMLRKCSYGKLASDGTYMDTIESWLFIEYPILDTQNDQSI